MSSMTNGMAGKLLKDVSLSNFQTPWKKFPEEKKQVVYKRLGIRMTLNS